MCDIIINMQVEVVVGANYGDEGKGMFTEHLCRAMPKPVVVMSNGGCQRGHTVNSKELSIRHVFHHFGSGTLLGVPSIYAKTFLLNPIKYIEEKRELERCGIELKVFRVPGCILQLPSDMFTNQMLESARAKDGMQHGSCGWGIWETQVRNAEFGQLTFDSFASMTQLEKCTAMQNALEWQLSARLAECRGSISTSLLECMSSEGFIKHFIQDFDEMARDVKCLESSDITSIDWRMHGIDAESIVVENAQGLLLDAEYAPEDADGKTDVHATPSRCGLAGALDALGSKADARSIEVNYITRSYMTRHGAGPFTEEDKSMHFEDKTNAPNDWQGSLRFGKIDDEVAAQLLSRAELDSKAAKHRVVVTHCNEAEPCALLKVNAQMLSYEDDSRKFMEA